MTIEDQWVLLKNSASAYNPFSSLVLAARKESNASQATSSGARRATTSGAYPPKSPHNSRVPCAGLAKDLDLENVLL